MIPLENGRAVAGSVAASGVVVAKQVPLRDPPRTQLPHRLRPSGLSDLQRLFSADDRTASARITRLSSAALMYSVDKSSVDQPAKVLHGSEHAVLANLHQARRPHLRTDRSCPHCRLLLGSIYEDRRRWRDLPPVGVVNHSARVNISFDPETNVSEANISHFQVLVPESIAVVMIDWAHPLRWANRAGWLFRSADPVERDGTRRSGGSRDDARRAWEQQAVEAGEAFMREDVNWPLNEDFGASAENIIKISDWEYSGTAKDHRWLRYRYSLECCVRSNFGIAWEPEGLDLDGGQYSGAAIPLGVVDESVIAACRPPGGWKRRDVLEMSAHYDPRSIDALYDGWSAADPTDDDQGGDEARIEDVVKSVRVLGSRLEDRWPELAPFWLVDVSASKEVHFTIPENGPIELWDMLTWTAPSILFAFLNHAVCLAPHLLLSMKSSEKGGLYA